MLTEEQQARVAVLQADLQKVDAATGAITDAIDKEVDGMAAAAANKRRIELYKSHQPELSELQQRRQPIHTELEPLLGEARRVSYVWLYENLARKAATPPARGQ
ncbi:MAG TPA: hypothetical protein VK348_03265 [Planctomycetota bacterium]|nr:hypothetical protein [Planctomycetota bacterium]